jgi:hypothetical protein
MARDTALLSNDRSVETGWKAASTLSAIAGGIVTRKVLQSLWTTFSSSELEPPLNPADRRVDWKPALQWAIAAGVGVGIGRLVSQRAAAAGWEAATGSAPPGIHD